MRRMIAVLTSDSPGVLARVSGLFARRAFNIDSLAVGGTDRAGISRMTISFEGDDDLLEKVTKQLNKLIDVYKVIDLQPGAAVSRELALVRVYCQPSRRPQVAQLVDLFRARIVDVSKRSMVIEASGTQEKIEALLQLLRDFGVKELVRTGPIALERGMAAREELDGPAWWGAAGGREDATAATAAERVATAVGAGTMAAGPATVTSASTTDLTDIAELKALAQKRSLRRGGTD